MGLPWFYNAFGRCLEAAPATFQTTTKTGIIRAFRPISWFGGHVGGSPSTIARHHANIAN